MRFLKIIYQTWMRFAHFMGWVNAGVFLSLVYFLIFAPLAIIFRLIRRDPMKRSFDVVDSYWIRREAKKFRQEDYRRLF